jgi:hypothetical protein
MTPGYWDCSRIERVWLRVFAPDGDLNAALASSRDTAEAYDGLGAVTVRGRIRASSFVPWVVGQRGAPVTKEI